MSPNLRELYRFVVIGLAFGLVWAAMQYIKGDIRDPVALAVPVIVFGAFCIVTWGLRRVVLLLRGRR